jgi:hypothetical protein
MDPATTAYMASAAGQLASISAFLGGFAATILATLILSDPRSRMGGLVIGASAAAAVSFVVCALAATTLGAGLNPNVPSGFFAEAYLLRAQAVMTLAFMSGICALLLAIGASGWLRSRRMGWDGRRAPLHCWALRPRPS